MLTVTIVCVGTLKEQYLRDAVKEYSKRISAYAKLVIKELKHEGEIIPSLPEKSYRIALCVEGKQLSSPELASKMEELPINGVSEITFVIGDSDGMREETKAKCNMRLSFSKMTFPHQLMRVILLEQIYRAFTIINNGKYHK